MALTKTTIVDSIDIREDGVINVRTDERVYDDATPDDLIGHRYWRVSYPPTTALQDVPDARVRAHAQMEWTSDVIAAYEEKIAKAQPPVPVP